MSHFTSYTNKAKTLYLTISTLLMIIGCDSPCQIGSSCDATCELGSAPICVTESICKCVAINVAGTEGGLSMGGGSMGGGSMNGGGEAGGTTEPPPVCEPLVLGDLIINEVMINPSESEPAHEYVELVNVSNKEIDLTGVNFTYNDEEKFRFQQGCMSPNSAVAAYSGGSGEGLLSWVWSTQPRGIGVYNYRYQFVNSRDFSFNLFSADGQLLSQFAGASNLINDGESITRSPELTGGPLEHVSASSNGSPSSPASCANGGTYEAGCNDGSAQMGGAMTGGETVGGSMAGGESMGGAMTGGQVIPPACSSPFVRDLLINELLIDAEGDENLGEFIEILNQSDQAVNLDGIQLLYQNSSGVMTSEVSFAPGCMAPHSALVIYNNTRDLPWLWSTMTSDSVALSTGHSPFPLANGRDAVLELQAPSGQRLSQLVVLRSEISEGVSANRSPDAVESSTMAQHDTLSTTPNSPGVRPDGTRYEDR